MASTPEVIGRYRVVRSLGEGGMGSVFVAHDPNVDRLVAIKLIYQARGADLEQLRERFRREARAVGSLRHINIVTLYEFGSHEGEPFIAMEYIEGETLGGLIRRQAPLPLARRLEIIEHACAGLHHAHSQGIVHRDIKPANVMVDRDGIVKILDFGIARGTDSNPVTNTGALIGTLNYMSPEQLGGRRVDARSDIFSLGAVLYEFITGTLAFPGDVQSGLLGRILSGAPDPILQDVPDSVRAILDKMLERDPAVRFQDLELVRQALANARAGLEGLPAPYHQFESTPSPRVVTNTASPASGGGALSDPLGFTPTEVQTGVGSKPQRRLGGRAAMAVAVLAAVIGAAWFAWPYFRSAPPPVAPSVLPGIVALEILPWANVPSIVRKADGKNVAPPDLMTPDVLSLEPGDYHLIATNPLLQQLDLDFTVTSGAYVELRRSMQGLQPDTAAQQGVRRQ